MQIAKCTVRLGGDLGFTVVKNNVTPAEIVMLKIIHGDDSVVDIVPTGSDKRPHAEERARLFGIYGAAKDGKDQNLFSLAFPGAVAKLPVSLADIGIGTDYSEDELEKMTAPDAQ